MAGHVVGLGWGFRLDLRVRSAAFTKPETRNQKVLVSKRMQSHVATDELFRSTKPKHSLP